MQMLRRHSSVLVLACMLSAAGCSSNQIDGSVVDNFDQVVDGASVEVVGTEFKAVTLADGSFKLDYAPGQFTVRASRAGSADAKRQLNIAQRTRYPLAPLLVIRLPDQPGFMIQETQRRAYHAIPVGQLLTRDAMSEGTFIVNDCKATELPEEVAFVADHIFRAFVPSSGTSAAASWTLLSATGYRLLSRFSDTASRKFACEPHQLSEVSVERNQIESQTMVTANLPTGSYCFVQSDRSSETGIGSTGACFKWKKLAVGERRQVPRDTRSIAYITLPSRPSASSTSNISAGRLLQVAVETGAVIGTMDLDGPPDALSVAGPAGPIYIANADYARTSLISAVDPRTNTEIGAVSSPFVPSHWPSISPGNRHPPPGVNPNARFFHNATTLALSVDGRSGFFTTHGGFGVDNKTFFSVFDTTTMTVKSHFEIGNWAKGNLPRAIAVTSDGKRAYVASTGKAVTIDVIDVVGGKVERSIPLTDASQLLEFKLGTDDRLYVLALREIQGEKPPKPHGIILVTQAEPGSAIQEIPIEDGVIPTVMTLSPDGRLAYVSGVMCEGPNTCGGTIRAIPLDPAATAARIGLGPLVFPADVAFGPAGGTIHAVVLACKNGDEKCADVELGLVTVDATSKSIDHSGPLPARVSRDDIGETLRGGQRPRMVIQPAASEYPRP
jgi:DNA-binding beta-propeller fold protein YncE